MHKKKLMLKQFLMCEMVFLCFDGKSQVAVAVSLTRSGSDIFQSLKNVQPWLVCSQVLFNCPGNI